MSLMLAPLRKYAVFQGRARRKEFWLFQLFVALLLSALYAWLFAVGGDLEFGNADASQTFSSGNPAATLPMAVIAIVAVFLFLPTLAVQIRRLHDSGKSGWWVLLSLTGIGSLVLFVFYLLDGTPGANRYGADPKGRATPTYN